MKRNCLIWTSLFHHAHVVQVAVARAPTWSVVQQIELSVATDTDTSVERRHPLLKQLLCIQVQNE